MTFWADEDFYDEPVAHGSVSWTHDVSGHSQTGINEFDAIVGDDHGFETVKPLRLFERIIQLWCPTDGLVVDPFAGSGTSGHAVLDLNDATGAQRRFILDRAGPARPGRLVRALTHRRPPPAGHQRRLEGGKRDGLGGGYRFLKLEKKVDADALLSMEREELVDTLIASHFDAAARRRDALVNVPTTPATSTWLPRTPTTRASSSSGMAARATRTSRKRPTKPARTRRRRRAWRRGTTCTRGFTASRPAMSSSTRSLIAS